MSVPPKKSSFLFDNAETHPIFDFRLSTVQARAFQFVAVDVLWTIE
jgi:hypothetical protein